MALLSHEGIKEQLTQLDGWELDGKEIVKSFKFKDFVDSIAFVTRVAFLAEKANHHPDISTSWNRVTLSLSTHSEGGITENDINLAGQIDGISL